MHNISKDVQNRSTNIGDIAADMYIRENFSGFSPEGVTNKMFGIIKKLSTYHLYAQHIQKWSKSTK